MDNEINSRLAAYRGVDPDEAPRFWTPEIVGLRLVEAYHVLSRLPSNWRPKKVGNAWPEMQKEWEDLLSPEAWENAMKEREANYNRKLVPTSDEISRADESLSWAMDHLSGLPLHSDALQLWAMGRAYGLNLSRILADRRKYAEALAAKMTDQENAKRLAIREALAKDVCKWGNRRIRDAKGDPEKIKAIRANAGIRFERAVKDAGALDTIVRPDQAVPGRVRVSKTMERYRKAACAFICDELQKAGAKVRPPAWLDIPEQPGN